MLRRNSILSLVITFFIAACGPANHPEDNKEYKEHSDGDNMVDESSMTEETTMEESSSEEAPSVFFVNLKDGDVVNSPFMVEMGSTGMVIEPAGPITEGRGHHHILINKMFIEEGVVIPADEQHLHFGQGQTEAELNLEPGEYQLTLQIANGAHQSYGEVLSKTISITVE